MVHTFYLNLLLIELINSPIFKLISLNLKTNIFDVLDFPLTTTNTLNSS